MLARDAINKAVGFDEDGAADLVRHTHPSAVEAFNGTRGFKNWALLTRDNSLRKQGAQEISQVLLDFSPILCIVSGNAR